MDGVFVFVAFGVGSTARPPDNRSTRGAPPPPPRRQICGCLSRRFIRGVRFHAACIKRCPRGGPACETLQFAVTPATGRNLWTGAGTDESLNTWNGPIIEGEDGTHHLFVPVCKDLDTPFARNPHL